MGKGVVFVNIALNLYLLDSLSISSPIRLTLPSPLSMARRQSMGDLVVSRYDLCTV